MRFFLPHPLCEFGRFNDAGSRINCVNSLFDVLLVVRIPDVGLIEATRFTSSG